MIRLAYAVPMSLTAAVCLFPEVETTNLGSKTAKSVQRQGVRFDVGPTGASMA
jgi:hypothetical protein